jgi:AraC-like DNA-binding protein
MMDYISPINRAIDYIEANLAETIDMESVAAAAGYSRFHFGRLFLAMVGETPAGYVRKRRLSEAAGELVVSKKRIIDIALDYQFQSQAAFTRAFRQVFGLSPGAYRKRGRLVRLSRRITLKQPRLFRLEYGQNIIDHLVPLELPVGAALPVYAYVVLGQRKSRSVLACTYDRVSLAFRQSASVQFLFSPD